MSRYLLLFLICSIPISGFTAAKRQFNWQYGFEDPEKGESRTNAANLLKFAVSSQPKWLRLVTGFTLSIGSTYKQGDISLGPYIYFLSDVKKSNIQPFFYAEGIAGVGQFDDKSHFNGGYEVGAGVDLKWFSSSGISLAIALNKTKVDSLRIWLGYYYF